MNRWGTRLTAVAGAVAVVGGAASVTAANAAAPAQPDVPPGEYRGDLASGADWLAHVPQEWNGTVVLFAHGFGSMTAQDAPDEETRQGLLERGYALVAPSYSGPSLGALESAVDAQFAPLAAFRARLGVGPGR